MEKFYYIVLMIVDKNKRAHIFLRKSAFDVSIYIQNNKISKRITHASCENITRGKTFFTRERARKIYFDISQNGTCGIFIRTLYVKMLVS